MSESKSNVGKFTVLEYPGNLLAAVTSFTLGDLVLAEKGLCFKYHQKAVSGPLPKEPFFDYEACDDHKTPCPICEDGVKKIRMCLETYPCACVLLRGSTSQLHVKIEPKSCGRVSWVISCKTCGVSFLGHKQLTAEELGRTVVFCVLANGTTTETAELSAFA